MTAPIQTGPIDVHDDDGGVTIVRSDGVRASIASAHAGMRHEPSPAELLHFAIAQNLPVESIERIVALSERMADRAASQEFARAMAAFQAECPPIKKTTTAKIATRSGGTYSYAYAELDEIAATVNPILAKHGLSYSWDTSVTKDVLKAVCTVRHINGHSVSATFELPIANESAMSPQQKVGAANTYAKRQSLIAALGLTTTEPDTDAQAVDPSPLDDDAVLEIDELIRSVGANKKRFLEYMGVDRIKDIRAADYQKAITALRRKQDKAR